MKFFTKNKMKFSFVVIFIILMVVYFYFYFYAMAEDSFFSFFSDSLLPELIGVCLEFIVILFFIDYIQKKEEKNRKIISEKRLREILIFFLRHIDTYLPEDIKISIEYPKGDNNKDEFLYGIHYEKNQKYLERLIAYFKEIQLSKNDENKIKAFCKREIATVRCLTPVVATLHDQNFKSWIRIMFYMDAIIANEYPVEESMAKIISHMKKFEKASFDNGWLVKDD
ncbi:TPA: hypothetical protein SMP24_001131 [Proteus mirabilis]|uniref:hypothetical protein n=1 Tax=Proteus TaxID=583 RepID=UPI0002833AC2|nr:MULTISPECIES: hypothetical protein [Proteus]AVB30045.1 hypothetical protein C3940_07670 [Proteus mirabilis]EKB01380.1 hypothetical protein HMPREF1311_00911 [Proteus mirabilis WGLW6]EMD5788683.1 hypothetical protein [Proteus mirabilis]KSW19579.1 hypothetical protein OL98_03890 [Proteus mirabilis]MCM0024980.1 hypothetical protein [Proteus mirabilis]